VILPHIDVPCFILLKEIGFPFHKTPLNILQTIIKKGTPTLVLTESLSSGFPKECIHVTLQQCSTAALLVLLKHGYPVASFSNKEVEYILKQGRSGALQVLLRFGFPLKKLHINVKNHHPSAISVAISAGYPVSKFSVEDVNWMANQRSYLECFRKTLAAGYPVERLQFPESFYGNLEVFFEYGYPFEKIPIRFPYHFLTSPIYPHYSNILSEKSVIYRRVVILNKKIILKKQEKYNQKRRQQVVPYQINKNKYNHLQHKQQNMRKHNYNNKRYTSRNNKR